MIKYLPKYLKFIFKFTVCILATIVFSLWWLITFDTKDWDGFLKYMWSNN